MEATAAQRAQKGAAYLTHRLRGDGVMLAAAAQDLGDWPEAAQTFLVVCDRLLNKLVTVTGRTPEELTAELAMEAAAELAAA